MDKYIKLSIVIPYYNTYDLTVKLLKQLEIQKTDEVEIILVDDGCHEVRFDDYKFIKVIHNETNLSAPVSWNIGIEASKGEYIAFIDSDDMIMPFYVDRLLEAINSNPTDEIMFGWLDMNKNILVAKPANVAIWKSIYRREICPRFRESWTYQSDIPFQWDLKKSRKTQSLLHSTLYLYNSNREGGLTWERIRNGKRNTNPNRER